MAYIPPHKRQPDSSGRPSPVPDSLALQFKKVFKSTSSRPNHQANDIVHASMVPGNWSVIGKRDDHNDHDDAFPSYVHLLPVSLEVFERRNGEKSLILVKKGNEVQGNVSVSPWVAIAENVQKCLWPSFDVVRKLMESHEDFFDDTKLKLVARFGKSVFFGTQKFSLDAARKSPVLESTLRKLKRIFYTGLPASFKEKIVNDVHKIGLSFVNLKVTYYIKLLDSTQEDVIFCKCKLDGDKILQLYKVKLNPVRHMGVDLSCIDKDLDLRVRLYSTKNLTTSLTDDEMHSIKSLINSAIIDPNVRGGLRWPFGKSVSEDRYEVIGIWHTVSTAYKSESLRLKFRHADRFDFIWSIGETTWETELFMKKIVSELEENADENTISDMLKSNMKIIWDHFLSCEEPIFSMN
ncbi:hypothetical protein ACFE04_024930 [Oxalis oulophora]